MEGALILVKHSEPILDENQSPKTWRLGDKGVEQTQKFSKFVKNNFDVDPVLFSSAEPKALDTAKILAENLSLELKVEEHLGEIDRKALPLMDEDVFHEKIKKVFDSPSDKVYGDESALEALQRFEEGIKKVLEVPLEEERLVVCHGTVMSLFLSKYNDEMNAFEIWQKLSCPSYAVVDSSDFRLLELNGDPLKLVQL